MSSSSVLPYGRAGSFIDLDCASASDRAATTHAVAAAARARWPEADVVMGAGNLAVIGVAPDRVRAAGELARGRAAPRGSHHEIAAVYDGPDLDEAAHVLGLSARELVARHVETAFVVELLGFQPGFAYLTAPAPGFVVPRRSTPRPRVPAGSIGLAAGFTGVYPFASPGGWHLIGRAVDATLFDAERIRPSLFAPGDHVRFVATSTVAGAAPRPDRAREEEPASMRRGLLVARAPALATVQDAGRPGLLAGGIAPSGPLDAEAFEAANAAVANPAGAAAIEIPMGTLEVEARGGSVMVSIDGARATTLRDGDRLVVSENDRAVRYLAVRGGVDVPVVMGARATLLAAHVGGHRGRPLRRGDRLAAGDAEVAGSPLSRTLARDEQPLAIDAGPHLARFPEGALDVLLSSTWRVSRHGDRVGVRLEGARVPRGGPDLALPVPMLRGAIEITTDGTPIVLGPDHPTTGGYPVLAVLRPTSFASLARRRPGEVVRFVS